MRIKSTLEIPENRWQEFAADCKRHNVVIQQSAPAMIWPWNTDGPSPKVPGYVVTAYREVSEGPVTAPIVGPEITYVLERYFRGFAGTDELVTTFSRYGVEPSPRLVRQREIGLLTDRDFGHEFIYQNLEWLKGGQR